MLHFWQEQKGAKKVGKWLEIEKKAEIGKKGEKKDLK